MTKTEHRGCAPDCPKEEVEQLLAQSSAQLHIALVVVSELLGCIDQKAHAWPQQQQACRAARQLLTEHGFKP